MHLWLLLRSALRYLRSLAPGGHKLSTRARLLLGVVARSVESGRQPHPFGRDYEAAAELCRNGYLHVTLKPSDSGVWLWSLTEKGKKALED